MLEVIRDSVARNGRLKVAMDQVENHQDLFSVGLSSFAAVQIMMAVEEAFDVEFPQTMMSLKSFTSVNTIAGCLAQLGAQPSIG